MEIKKLKKIHIVKKLKMIINFIKNISYKFSLNYHLNNI